MDKQTYIWTKLMNCCANHWGCHQIPERSFFIKGYQFPVCARCAGIITGYLFALSSLCFIIDIPVWFYVILLVPMGLDGSIQYLTHYRSTNIKRFFTGFIAGFAFIRIIVSLLSFIFSILYNWLAK